MSPLYTQNNQVLGLLNKRARNLFNEGFPSLSFFKQRLINLLVRYKKTEAAEAEEASKNREG